MDLLYIATLLSMFVWLAMKGSIGKMPTNNPWFFFSHGVYRYTIYAILDSSVLSPKSADYVYPVSINSSVGQLRSHEFWPPLVIKRNPWCVHAS